MNRLILWLVVAMVGALLLGWVMGCGQGPNQAQPSQIQTPMEIYLYDETGHVLGAPNSYLIVNIVEKTVKLSIEPPQGSGQPSTITTIGTVIFYSASDDGRSITVGMK